MGWRKNKCRQEKNERSTSFWQVSAQSQYGKHTMNYVIAWLFLLFCDITSLAVLKLYFSNSNLNTHCVFGEKKYKQLEAENIY